jgi:peroxiredoxin
MRLMLVALLLIAHSGSVNSTQTTQRASESAVAPAFSLKALNGRVARLSDYRGKVVLINLWASWCAPCRVELPELVRLQRQYKARGLQIVGVTFPDDDAASVRRMTRQFKLNYPILFGTNDLLEAYQIGEVLPVTVIVDRDGIIRERILGILEPEEFKNRVVPLLQTTEVH